MKRNKLGIYIHVPFCLRKCGYCDFYSVKPDDEIVDMYFKALEKEIVDFDFTDYEVDTIYFGGGTPSAVKSSYIWDVIDKINSVASLTNPEITIELNPNNVTDNLIRNYREMGVNRVSIGVQSLNDNEIVALGRLHNSDKAVQSINSAAKYFDNISADIMIGIPHQTIYSLQQTLDRLFKLPLTHISSYMLKIEKNTPFYKNNIATICPDEDLTADLYLNMVSSLAEKGFEQYEISNFCKKNYESRHNLKYWNYGEYVGFGASAHSFVKGKRFYNKSDLMCYINKPLSKNFEDITEDMLTYVMLKLRLKKGLDLVKLKELYNFDYKKIEKKVSTLQSNGLIIFKDNNISLTPKGFLVSNSVITWLFT